MRNYQPSAHLAETRIKISNIFFGLQLHLFGETAEERLQNIFQYQAQAHDENKVERPSVVKWLC